LEAPTRVVLVDSRELIRRGIRTVLAGAPDFEVVGEAEDGAGALRLLEAERPQMALINVRLASGDGPALCRSLMERDLPTAVVVVTDSHAAEFVEACIRLGVRGYLGEEISAADLLYSLRQVVRGGSVLDPSTTHLVLGRLREGGTVPAALAPLSEGDRAVLRLVADGLTTREIGRRLYLSENTVKARINDIVHRLHAKNRVEAAVIAERRALL
jgi:two-component system response regulator DevR